MCLAKNRKQAGFTLIEIIVSLTLLGLMGAAVFSGWTQVMLAYCSAMEQSECLPQVDAARNALCTALRHGTAIVLTDLQNEIKSVTGITDVSIKEVDDINGNEDPYKRAFEVTLTYSLVNGRKITEKFYVENGTGALLKHWGMEYNL